MLNEDSAEKRMSSENPFNLIWIIPAQEDYANTLFSKKNVGLPYFLAASLFVFSSLTEKGVLS